MNWEKISRMGPLLFRALFAIAVFGVLIYAVIDIDARRAYNRVHVKGYIESQGFEMISGRVDSPSVVIKTKNLDDFITKAKELNANTIYFNESSFKATTFYVFEDNMLVSYYYTHLWDWPVE